MENILVYQEYSDTIRQMPSNYCIASKKGNEWVMNFDPAANKDLVLRVCVALFEHENRYGTGLKLLSAVTPNSEFQNDEKEKLSVLELVENYELKEDWDDDPQDYLFYEYIVNSIINGQRKQAFNLYDKLQDYDKEQCLSYVKENYIEEGNCTFYKDLLETIVQNYES